MEMNILVFLWAGALDDRNTPYVPGTILALATVKTVTVLVQETFGR